MSRGAWRGGGLTAIAVADNGFLPLKALAEYSGLSVRQLRNLLADPIAPLPHYKLPNKVLVRKADFDAYMLRYRCDQAPAGARSLAAIVDDVVAGMRR